MDTNDVNARLAALQARRQPPQATAATGARSGLRNPLTGRPRKHHPARRARIATGAMSVVAMFGITGYMAANDASASAGSTAATVTAATNAAASTATTATATITTAATVTKGS